MVERAVQSSPIDPEIIQIRESLFLADEDKMDKALDRDIGDRHPWVKRVKAPSVHKSVLANPKTKIA